MRFQKAIDRALWQIAVDLSNTMPGEVQSQRLVSSIGSVLPCDAVSLMHLREGTLVPMASTGLSPDLMGRRFDPAAHPRLAAILDAHNRAHLRQMGQVIYLDVSIEEQLKRVRHDRNRPLLQTTDLETRLRSLAQQRSSLYQQTAHWRVSGDGLRSDQVLRRILRYLHAQTG